MWMPPRWLPRPGLALAIPVPAIGKRCWSRAPGARGPGGVCGGGGGRGGFVCPPGGWGGVVGERGFFDSSEVMGELTRADDPDMGQVLGSPRIMKIRPNAPMRNGRRQAAVYRWFAVVGSGVNNHVPHNNQPQPRSRT